MKKYFNECSEKKEKGKNFSTVVFMLQIERIF
jgi:hypothetical protein